MGYGTDTSDLATLKTGLACLSLTPAFRREDIATAMAATFPLTAAPLLGRHPAAARARIEMIERVMERAFVIPGINRPIGLDAIIGLVPVAGDLIAGAIGVWLVVEAAQLGVGKWTLARMLANVGIDTALGSIPVAGDLFDFLFKSNSMNLRLIRKHLDRHHPGTVVVDARR